VSDALPPSSQVERKIRAALDEETSIEFIDSPLQDICDYLSDYHHITIQIDSKALDENGLGPDVPITGNLRRVSLRSALNLLLAKQGLAWAVRDEAVLITTADAARANPTVRVYNVTDLIPNGGTSEDLVQALNSVLRCQQPDDATSSIRIAAYQQLILVRATEQKLYELETLLAQIQVGIHGATHATPAAAQQATQHKPHRRLQEPTKRSRAEREQEASSAGASTSKQPDPFGGGEDPFAKPTHPATSGAEDPFAPSKADPFGAGAAKKPPAEREDPFNE